MFYYGFPSFHNVAENRGSKKNVNENGSVSECKRECYISKSRPHNHAQQARLCLT